MTAIWYAFPSGEGGFGGKRLRFSSKTDEGASTHSK